MAYDFHSLLIGEVRRETAEAISVSFELPEALRPVFVWKPGQHLGLRSWLDGKEQRRTYSICAGPADRCLQIAIKRVPGGCFSTWANDTLAAGQRMDVMPPAGRFVLPAGGSEPRHILAIAAGAGITPIIAMIEYALAGEPHTSVTLVYGNRRPQSIMFRERLEDLKDRHVGRLTLLHVLSRTTDADTPLLQGRIDGAKVKALVQGLLPAEAIAHAFLCGPGSLIKEARNALLEMGLPRQRIHHEFFAAANTARRQLPTAPPAAEDRVVANRMQDTQAIAIVDGLHHAFAVPRGGHVVDAALAAGIRVPYSCKGGMCCTCRARIVEGTATMTTNYSLEPWEIERGFILACQAVPEGEKLVLDFDQM